MRDSALRILVADDDPEVLQDVAGALEGMGAVVTVAASGGDLIEALGNPGTAFDLVVTDVAMPWMTGLQAVAATRYAGLATPVIVMTALRDDKIPAQVEALGRGAVLLRKPFGMTELEHAVETLVS
ncbi:MAG TPA: response regulator [Kofleriaceae bacterium]|nr:response regulator [Kofleriaceae bacterium]